MRAPNLTDRFEGPKSTSYDEVANEAALFGTNVDDVSSQEGRDRSSRLRRIEEIGENAELLRLVSLFLHSCPTLPVLELNVVIV